jgi:enamine deaminase RidA (YjgF/YER057c/UK114 family)
MLVGVAVLAATISVVFVAGLAHPDFLLEVEAVAVIPEE